MVHNASQALMSLDFVLWSDNAGKQPTAGSFMLKAHVHISVDSSLLLQVGLSIC